MAHSPPEGRQAVPWSEVVFPLVTRVARNARQISSVLTNGWPTGAKLPFDSVSGLSQDTDAPLPCGSRAMARAPLARRQSSAPSSGERGEAMRGLIELVVSGS